MGAITAELFVQHFQFANGVDHMLPRVGATCWIAKVRSTTQWAVLVISAASSGRKERARTIRRFASFSDWDSLVTSGTPAERGCDRFSFRDHWCLACQAKPAAFSPRFALPRQWSGFYMPFVDVQD